MNHLLVSFHTCPFEEPGTGLAGGMNVFLSGLLAGLAGQGVRTDVLTRGKGRRVSATEPVPGVRVFHVPCGWKEPPTREAAYGCIPQFVRVAKGLLAGDRGIYDAVSAHYWMSGAALRGILRKPLPKSVSLLTMDRALFMYHTLEARKAESEGAARGILSLVRKREEERLAAEAGRVVFLSRHDYTRTARILPAVAGKGSVVPPGLDESFLHPPSREAARKKGGVPKDFFLFLLAARPDPGKNVDSALRAFRTVRSSSGDSTGLLIAGLEISGSGLPEGVSCTGPVPHAVMPFLFAAADAVLCPSTYESFGLVPLEAMASGTPPVVPSGSYWGSRIRSLGGGVVYDPRRKDGLANAMLLLMRDRSLRRRLAVDGRKIAAEFTWERCSVSWARLLSRSARPGNRR